MSVSDERSAGAGGGGGPSVVAPTVSSRAGAARFESATVITFRSRWGWKRLLRAVLCSAFLWGILASACVMVGSSGEIGWPANRDVAHYRLQIVLLASLVGAALATAGVTYQAVLQNPLADPYLLGVSSGAMLGGYLWQQSSAHLGLAIGEQGFAFAGALVSVGVVLMLASRRGRLEPITMLLVGVIVNAINASIFLLLNAVLKDPARPGGPMAYLVGGLHANLSSAQIWIAAVVVSTGWVLLMWLSGQLNVALLSESEASALGLRVHHLRWTAIVTASLVTASVVALSGPIGFVGLVCPHLARLVVGNDQRRLLPLSTALGAGLLALADATSRWLASRRGVDTVLPVGVLTGLLGAPFFLLLLWRRERAIRK